MGTFSKSATSAIGALLFVVVPNLSLAVAATSDDLFNDYFSNVLAGTPCFARTYDDAHLNAHPSQRVRAIEIDLSKSNSDGTPNSADRFELGFALMLRSGPEWFGQSANCKTNETDFECYLESDGGIFRLIPQKGGGLRLEAGESGISLEGSNGDVELSGKNGEDRVFDLVPSNEECQAASAYFEGGNE